MIHVGKIAAALGLAQLALTPNFAQAQEVLRLGGVIYGDHSSVRAIEEVFIPEVEGNTDGRYAVEIYSNAELGGNAEIVQQTRNGTIFGGFVSSGWVTSYVPLLSVGGLPFLFETREDAFRAFDSPAGEPVREAMLEAGFEPLGFMELGFRHITTSSKFTTTPEDLAGMRIRLQPNQVHMETFRLLGANPTQIDGSELFSALNQGVADGQENPYSVISMFRLDEAGQTYLTQTGHFYDILTFIGSKRILDRMSDDDRRVILEAAERTTQLQRQYAAEEEADFRAALLENGVEMQEITAEQRLEFQEVTAPLYESVAEELGQEFVDEFVATARGE